MSTAEDIDLEYRMGRKRFQEVTGMVNLVAKGKLKRAPLHVLLRYAERMCDLQEGERIRGTGWPEWEPPDTSGCTFDDYTGKEIES